MNKPLIIDITVRDPMGGKVFQQKGKDMPKAMAELDTFMKSKYTGENPAMSVPKILIPEGL